MIQPTWKAAALIVGVAVTVDILVIQAPLLWISVCGILAIGAQLGSQMRSLAVVMITCGLFTYSPFESGMLSRLYPGDIAIGVFVTLWLVTEKSGSVKQLFQPALINRQLCGIVIVMLVSMGWSRLHPDPSVVYTFPHSDISWSTTQIAQIVLLGATICVPFAVAAAVKTLRDAENLVITVGVVVTLGTLVTLAAIIYGFGGSYDILGETRAYWEQPWQASIRLTELILPFLYSGVLFGRRSLTSYWAMCLLFVFCLLGVVLTFSRQSWLVAVFGILCVSVVWLRQWIIIPVALGVVVLIMLLAWSPGSVKHVSQFYNPSEIYGLDRIYFYITGMQLFVTHPIVGIGAGNYQFFDRVYAEVASGGISHNEFITVAAETGILGLSMLLWLMIALLRIPQKWNVLTVDRTDPLYWIKVGGSVFVLAWIAECFFQEAFFVTAAAGGGTKVMTATVFPWILLGLLFAVSRLCKSVPDRNS